LRVEWEEGKWWQGGSGRRHIRGMREQEGCEKIKEERENYGRLGKWRRYIKEAQRYGRQD
jgi:hypothetical protein